MELEEKVKERNLRFEIAVRMSIVTSIDTIKEVEENNNQIRYLMEDYKILTGHLYHPKIVREGKYWSIR